MMEGRDGREGSERGGRVLDMIGVVGVLAGVELSESFLSEFCFLFL